MKIAFISTMNGSQWGGSEELWSQTALHALHEGHEILVSIYDWGNLHPKVEILKKHGAIIHLRKVFNPNQSLGKKVILHFKNRFKIFNNYKKVLEFRPERVLFSQGECYDVVIHHYEIYLKLIENKIPYSVVCHSNQEYSYIPNSSIYPKAKNFFINAKKVYLVADKMQKVLERQLCMIFPNSQKLWNPVNLTEFKALEYNPSDIVEFGVIGYLGYTKGQDTLLEIFKNEKWKNRSWKLNIYGNGYGMQYLKDLSDFYKISDKVTFHGQVSDINKVWAKNHALVIGSSVEWMPLSLMEAMLCGRVAIVPDIGGISELAVDKVTAFIAKSPSVKAIYDALEDAWANKDKWKEMGQNAYFHACSVIDLSPQRTLLQNIIKN